MVNNQSRRQAFDPWVGKISWKKAWQPTSVSLPGKSNGHRSLVGYSSRGRKELDTTERLSNVRAPSRQPWASAPWGGHRADPGWHSGSSPHRQEVRAAPSWASPRLWRSPGWGGLVRTSLSSLPRPSRGFPPGSLSCLPSSRTLVTEFRADLLQYDFLLTTDTRKDPISKDRHTRRSRVGVN